MYTFDKSKRLLKKKEYNHVFALPKKVSNRSFVMLYQVNEFDFPRLGLAIAKKNIAKACRRNSIKRLIRETFRVQTLANYDIVVIAKQNIANLDNQTIINHLRQLWDKL